MRTSFLLTFICLVVYAFGQVPNGGFEDWTARSVDQVDDWKVGGLVEQSSDATDGDFSIRLDTRASDDAFGIVTNADLNDDLTGGQPYTDIPLVMKFDVKYDLSPGDVAKVLAIFKLQGQAIGAVDYTMNGNSGDSFQHVSYPIQWATQVNPDSLIVVISSVDIETPSFNGDGYVIIDNIEFKSFSTLHDSINNRSFEDWGTFDIDHPQSWYTTDLYISDLLNLPVQFGAAKKPAHVQSGSESLLLSSIKIENDIIPGVAITGKSVEDFDKPSFPVNRRWGHLQGLYKYAPVNGDKAVIAATLFSNGSLIGAAQLSISDSSRMDEYTYFSAPIQYIGGGTPDSATVIISSADLENPLGDSSRLWIDNVSFTDHTASIPIVPKWSAKVYPNPVNNILRVELSSQFIPTLRLINTHGQLVYSGSGMSIDMHMFRSGIYVVEVMHEGLLISRERVVKL